MSKPFDLLRKKMSPMAQKSALEKTQKILHTNGINDDKVPIDVTLVKRLIATQFSEWKDLPIRPVESSG